MLKVRLFASLREEVGQEVVELEVPDECTVDSLLKTFASRYPKAASMGSVLVAVNKEVARPEDRVKEGDEVALLPPVSGGAMRRIVEEDFDVASVLEEMRHPEEGALVLFLGSVRGVSGGKAVTSLQYEVYREMAEEQIRRIEEEVREETGARRVLVQHRIGKLPPGERTILVAALSRHRAEAFEACRRALERVKSEVPIWKKEVYERGEAWVRPHADTSEE
jgi:molybdopterin synthase catalytic subunit